MFRFANIDFLYLLILIPVLILVWVWLNYIRRRAMKGFADPAFFDILMPLRSALRRNLKFLLFLMAITSIIIALARPQFGSRLEEVKREGIEMIIALDVSRSMLAEDIRPNRLERAKQAITNLVNHMQDDRIGLIVFAGDANTQLPITSDFISAKMFLASINTGTLSRQGTAIASAINLGANSFTQDTEADKVIVIISDGESHEGDALGAAKAAAEKGISIYTIGMGTTKGAAVPLPDGQGLLKDRQGKVVISRMNPSMLQEIAAAGNGKFYAASTGNVGLERLYSELNKLDKSEIDTREYSEYDDQFHYFLAFGLILLIIDIFILERRSRFFRNVKLFETGKND
jgi:Ca-activated chloride channel homolog